LLFDKQPYWFLTLFINQPLDNKDLFNHEFDEIIYESAE